MAVFLSLSWLGKEIRMTIGELKAALDPMDPDNDVFVACFNRDGTGEAFDIDAVQEYHGDAQLDIDAEGEGSDEEDGNGTVKLERAQPTPDAAEDPAEAFVDFCERRGITAEEKDLIWNAMAFICYEQVESQHGPFYEAIKPLLDEGDA
jgi:hypothetical protein